MNVIATAIPFFIAKLMVENAGQGAVIFTITRLSLFSSLALLLWLIVMLSSDRELKSYAKGNIITIFLLFSLALAFRMAVPHTMRLFFDEDIYLAMGREVLSGKSCLCAAYINNSCIFCEPMKWPPLNPLLAAVSFLIGVAPRTFFIVASSLQPVFAFLAFRKREEGVVAGIALAIHPLLGLWGTEFASESLMTTLILLLVALASRKKWKALAVASALASYSKTEAVVLFPISALISGKREWKTWVIASLFLVPAFVHVMHFSRTDTWGSQGSKFSTGYFMRNAPENARFLFIGMDGYFESKQLLHPPMLSWIALLSIPAGFVVPWVYATTLFLLYSSFYAGSVFFGVDVRYMVPVVSMIVIAATRGSFWIAGEFRRLAALALNASKEKLNRNLKEAMKKLAAIATVAIAMSPATIVMIYDILNLPTIMKNPGEIEEARNARLYRDFVMSNMEMLRSSGCIVISHVAALYRWNGVSSVQPWYAERNPGLLKSSECVVFDYGFWCRIPTFEGSCNRFLRYSHTTIDKTPDGRYALYRLWV